jgi:hypothetical protein
MSDAEERLGNLRKAVEESPGIDLTLGQRARAMELRLAELRETLSGDRQKSRRQVPTKPSLQSRIQTAYYRSLNSTAPISQIQRDNYDMAEREFRAFLSQAKQLIEVDLAQLEADADSAGVPWTNGRRLPEWP